ncbi:MAG: hybrid sensor histidine kinase/response regulator, partial [Mucilaginibacter polytrichastri]|nr:hybrid sensor histidine kinase/response regulator [Mucilaginibacter polytrichastri]
MLNKPPEVEKIPIVKYVSLADASYENYTIKDVAAKNTPLLFKRLKGDYGHLGFTDHIYWASFTIENSTAQPLFYYLEAGVAMTDRVSCFLSSAGGGFTKQLSGDEIAFSKRSVKHRDPLFNISLRPHEKKQVYLEIRNDGERNMLPINLLSEKYLFQSSYLSQIKMGFFYGMLLIIAITYLFFFIAINERSFLVYSLYVVFVGLCQFSLDGLFHQYISPGGSSWLSTHAVIMSAIFAAYFFGRYSELVLNIRNTLPLLHTTFRGLYVLLGLVMVAVLMAPPFLRFSYPIVNILTLGGIILIFATIVTLLIQGRKMDVFYMIGIGFLFFTILASILSNFGFIDPEISSDDITKLGIGLENIALSLSMANRIRL